MDEQTVVTVRRSGGFLGRSVEASVVLPADGSGELARLLAAVDVGALRSGPPRPDMFTYDLTVTGPRAARAAGIPEHLLPDPARRLVERVLEAGAS